MRITPSLPYYRTNNFAGLPKGSYCIPNPQHFHIVRKNQIAKPQRPILVKVAPHLRAAHYVFNRFNVNCDKNTQTVTINIGNYRAVSLSMSLQTVDDFIRPFANALNILNTTDRTHRGAQTSYVVQENTDVVQENTDYTPLVQSYVKENDKVPNDSNFEQQILQKLHENLVSDLTEDDSKSELDEIPSLNLDQGESETESPQAIIEFTDDDSLKVNENLSEIPEDESQVDDFESENSQNVSPDESWISSGLGDSEKLSPPNDQSVSEVDDKVLKISHIIYDYMSEQGFEDSDLVIFPELNIDNNTTKLIRKLKETYYDFYGDELTSEDRSDLRIAIDSCTLNLIKKDDRMMSSSDSFDFSVSADKVFSVSETVSAILDLLFEALRDETNEVNENDFGEPMKDENHNIYHSTPGPSKKGEELEVTVFKQNKLHMPRYESYWFAIGSPRGKKIVHCQSSPKKVIKGNGTFSRASFGLNSGSFMKPPLSPILEEASSNLSLDFLEEGEGDEEEDVDLLGGGDSLEVESILPHPYVIFDEPGSRVVVCSNVSFNRTTTTASSAYVKADSVLFNKKNNSAGDESFYSTVSDLNTSDDEGDWMGYEKAKF